MELRHLRYFVAVAEELHFSRAAEKLRIAQPALSRQIRDLEADLGAQLFSRPPARVALTAAGKVFLQDARSILRMAEDSRKRIRAVANAPAELRVGYLPTVFQELIARTLRHLGATHSDMRVRLHDFDPVHQGRALVREEIDLGLMGLPDVAVKLGLEHKPFWSTEVMVALPAHHPAARKRKVALKSLRNDRFVVISGDSYPGVMEFVQKQLAEAGLHPEFLEAVDSGHSLLTMIAGGMGVALAPEPLRFLRRGGVVFRSVDPVLRVEYHVAWKRNRLPESVEPFLECVRTAAQELSMH